MKKEENPLKCAMTRRKFVATSAQLAAGAAVLSTGGCAGTNRGVQRQAKPLADVQTWAQGDGQPVIEVADSRRRTLLKGGLVVDGTGRPAFYGDVLLNGDRIETVTPGRIDFAGKTLDCTGKVVAPGIIDAHSHMDWVIPMTRRPELADPFTEQGVTTVVAGNCGYGVAGFKKNSPHRKMLETRVHGMYDLGWDTMAEYFDHIRSVPMAQNLVTLSGHGTTRTSIRGFDPTPMDSGEMKEMVYLLEQTLEQGAAGVSFGLQYEPGVFATMEEMKQVAEMVRRRDKIFTVHMKAYSSLSGTYPLKFFGRPHNLLAIEDMIHLAEATGVRLQMSHLIFVGSRTWTTCTEALDLIDAAIARGLDIQFDTYAYHCGTSIINVFMPEWFLARLPRGYDDTASLLRLRMEIMLMETLLGFGYDDIQITDARHPDLEKFNGLFVSEIAKRRGMSNFDAFVDIARKTRGRARVLNHRYSNMANIELLMQHPASIFMTDATPALSGVQNPGAYGNFPLFLQYARDRRLLCLEDCVRKMTGAAADRFAIRDRGYLKAGLAADVTLFDWEKVNDNNTRAATDQRPTGIDQVFVNGVRVLKDGKLTGAVRAGRIL